MAWEQVAQLAWVIAPSTKSGWTGTSRHGLLGIASAPTWGPCRAPSAVAVDQGPAAGPRARTLLLDGEREATGARAFPPMASTTVSSGTSFRAEVPRLVARTCAGPGVKDVSTTSRGPPSVTPHCREDSVAKIGGEAEAGQELYDVAEKVFPDIKAEPGEEAWIFMHTVPYEGSVGLVNLLTATRLGRKGFKVSLVLYWPGVLMASGTRGYPAVGQEAFPGHMANNNQIKTQLKEGATINASRFAMGAHNGFREEDQIRRAAFNPLDVLDRLTAWRNKAFSSTPGRSDDGPGASVGERGEAEAALTGERLCRSPQSARPLRAGIGIVRASAPALSPTRRSGRDLPHAGRDAELAEAGVRGATSAGSTATSSATPPPVRAGAGQRA
jgi:uncharacterized repeat protein (TIGR04044 family)